MKRTCIIAVLSALLIQILFNSKYEGNRSYRSGKIEKQSFRNVSQIFEAQDCGINIDDTVGAVGKLNRHGISLEAMVTVR